ncbi:MAG: hypothetical protein KF686_03440 [Ramlibacter sp.]|nr:hypothetical protein [Ramlibacter sp.]
MTFTSGRTKYAHGGIIGIDPALIVSEGYDGPFFRPAYEWETPEEYEEGGSALTPEERVELADFMIARWEAFKAEANHAPTPLDATYKNPPYKP